MVASVAVLPDIHAVLPALDAVLAEPGVRDAEALAIMAPRDGRVSS